MLAGTTVMRWLLCTALLGCSSVYSVSVHYPTSSRCTSVVAFATDWSERSAHARGNMWLNIIDLASQREKLHAQLCDAQLLGISPDGPMWLVHEGEVEARDVCSGAVITTLASVHALHPELGKKIMSSVYDAKLDGLRVMNERAEGFVIDSKTLAVSRAPIGGAHSPERVAQNWVRWPGEPEVENWALWGTGAQHLARTADILANETSPKPASELVLFDGELMHDESSSAILEAPQSVLVSYRSDLIDTHLWISRVARDGTVLWTRDAKSYELAGESGHDRTWNHQKPHDAHTALGFVFAVVRTHLVAIDPSTGEVRWRVSLVD